MTRVDFASSATVIKFCERVAKQGYGIFHAHMGAPPGPRPLRAPKSGALRDRLAGRQTWSWQRRPSGDLGAGVFSAKGAAIIGTCHFDLATWIARTLG